MKENRQFQDREQNEKVNTDGGRSNTHHVTDPSIPDNRLKDGTNDFKNGDQNETSERTSDLDDESNR